MRVARGWKKKSGVFTTESKRGTFSISNCWDSSVLRMCVGAALHIHHSARYDQLEKYYGPAAWSGISRMVLFLTCEYYCIVAYTRIYLLL